MKNEFAPQIFFNNNIYRQKNYMIDKLRSALL